MVSTPLAQSLTYTEVINDLPITKESTTSRVFVNNELMRVVYFSFDKGQLLTSHSSPRAVVVTLLDGTMDFTVGGQTHHLSAGDFVYLAPHEEHALVATSACHMSLVLVDATSLSSQDSQEKTQHGQRSGPQEQRMQGHWLLASMGKKVLRPGGRELTQDMLSHISITPRTDVIEFGPGVGHTAAQLLQYCPHSYTAIDRDKHGTRQVMALLEKYGQATYISADAKDAGLPDECADCIIGEAMLTMQPDKGKRRIISEAARMLRPGGTYAIHELAFVPDSCPQELQDEVAAQLRATIKVGARPLTPHNWAALLEEYGFHVTYKAMRPMALLEPQRIISDEGIVGAAKFAKNVARNKAARTRILAMRKIFRQYRKDMAGVALVATKK